MLLKFSVKNFKNFDEWFEFDFAKTKNYSYNTECIRNNVINNSLIYGENSSGKSNLGFAIFDIISNITDREIRKESYENYLNANKLNELAEFKYEFKFNDINVKYSYGKKSLEDIIYEKLIIADEVIFEYDKNNLSANTNSINLEGAENLVTDFSKIKISIARYIKNNTVLAENSINSTLGCFFDFVSSMLHFRNLDDRFYQGYSTGSSSIFDDMIENNKVDEFSDFLQEAGIDCNLDVRSIGKEKKLVLKFGNNVIDFWKNSSTGTHSLTVFYYWLQQIKNRTPSLVFIDEFDAFYHQNMSEFVSKKISGADFQTILTTHNTSLLNNEQSRADCCFILKNNHVDSMAFLTDKELRLSHNIEKMYRAGSFDNG